MVGDIHGDAVGIRNEICTHGVAYSTVQTLSASITVALGSPNMFNDHETSALL